MRAPIIGLLLTLISWTAPAQTPPVDCGTPDAARTDWAVATPAEAGLDPALLCAIGPRFAAWREANVHAILVIRHGKLVYERYFAGEDEHHGQSTGVVTFDAGTKHDLRSISKSVTGLLAGIAIGKGQLPGVDQPVLAMLPGYADLRTPEKDRITIRHLLTMSLGLKWNEDLPVTDPANNETQMDEAPDPVRYVLSQPVESPPGQVFKYNGGATNILAALLRQATKQPLDVVAKAVLFDPLGISDFEWIRLPSGDALAASGLRLRPRDTAKIGQLVLNHGAWNGKQVVPADWIAAATAPSINAYLLWFYGYQFWLGRSLHHGTQVDWVEGRGLGGQRLYIVPSLDMIVLVHAGLYRSSLQGVVTLSVLNRSVLPAVTGP